MAIRIRTVRNTDELARAMGAIGHYFGWVPTAEQIEPFLPSLPLDRMHAAFDDGEIVGGADVRDRGEPIAALWASEDTIYGRYGYGPAARCVDVRLPRVSAQLRPGLP